MTGFLHHNGYAWHRHLQEDAYLDIVRDLEIFQSGFLARTRAVWDDDFPIPGDALAHFTRQWEYPFAWSNLADQPPGRLLDAGSGITFFPYRLAAAGHDVHCFDHADGLRLPERYAMGNQGTGCSVTFTAGSLTDPPYEPGSFDTVLCLSVLEHVGPAARDATAALAALVRPGGRFIVTVDVSLRGDTDLRAEDLAVLLADLQEHFVPVHPLDLSRPADLLTSDDFRRQSTWRLPWPWQPVVDDPLPGRIGTGHPHFRSIAVLGVALTRRKSADVP